MPTTRSCVVIAAGIAVSLVVGGGCGRENDLRPQEAVFLQELTGKGIGKYLGLQPTGTVSYGAWSVEYFTSPAVCLEGAPFISSVRRNSPDKVILFLEGGGGCWDYISCYGSPSTLESKVGYFPKGSSGGILDGDDARNPFSGWSVVYGAYCDGSVWAGDVNNTYVSPDGVVSKSVQHHGQANVSAMVTQIRDYFPTVNTILVAGCSAGGYGTLMAYMVARVQFPGVTIRVIDDSGTAITNPDSPALLNNAQKAWGFSSLLPPGVECPKCGDQLLYVVEWFLRYDRLLRFGLVSYYQDPMIGTAFLQLTGEQYKKLLVSTTNDIRSRFPGTFKRYFMTGQLHTILTSREFYYSKVIKGKSLPQWAHDLTTGSSGWEDVLE